MKVSELINGETIQIDNHNRGQIFTSKGLHLHKRMNQSKYMYADVIISLERVQEVEYRKCTEKQSQHIFNEIKKAFKNETVRMKFIKSFHECLSKIIQADNSKSKEEQKTFVEEAIKIIGQHFCNGKIDLITLLEGNTKEFLAEYNTANKERIFIKTNINNECITIGKEKEIVKDINS